jgi:hypothetical protein
MAEEKEQPLLNDRVLLERSFIYSRSGGAPCVRPPPLDAANVSFGRAPVDELERAMMGYISSNSASNLKKFFEDVSNLNLVLYFAVIKGRFFRKRWWKAVRACGKTKRASPIGAVDFDKVRQHHHAGGGSCIQDGVENNVNDNNVKVKINKAVSLYIFIYNHHK